MQNKEIPVKNNKKSSRKNRNKNSNTAVKLNHLFNLALSLRNYDMHISLIKKMVLIANKFLIKLPLEIKRSYCHKCFRLKMVNCKSEIIKKGKEYYFIVECSCGEIKKYKLKKEISLNEEVSKLSVV